MGIEPQEQNYEQQYQNVAHQSKKVIIKQLKQVAPPSTPVDIFLFLHFVMKRNRLFLFLQCFKREI